MNRTKLDDRAIKPYSREEEVINMLTHILGIILGMVVLVMTVTKGIVSGNDWGLASGVIFSVSMLILYTASTIYHGCENDYRRKVLQVVDHCTIYFLIAGTIIPICFMNLRVIHPALAWALFGISIATGLVGIVFTAIDLNKYKALSMVGYLSPWFLIFIVKQIIEAYTANFIWYLVGGGVAYTIGAICYAFRKKYMHAVFHIFILIGSLIHFIGIYDCCL